MRTRQRGQDSRLAVLMIAYTHYESDPRVMRAAEACSEAGFSVDVLSLRREGQLATEHVRGVRVIRIVKGRYRGRSRVGYIGAYGWFLLRCAIAAALMTARRAYSVVHVHNMPDALVFAALGPRMRGARVILDIHDPMPETLGAKYAGSRDRLHRILLYLERLSVGFADRTITVNEPVRDHVLVKHGYRRADIDVVANFADPEIFALVPEPPPLACPVRFVFHGTILERYGLRTLIEALTRLPSRRDVRVRIVGEGDFSDRLKALIHERHLDDTIEFVNRAYPLREIPRLLADCHVGLVPLDPTPIADMALPLKMVEYTCLGIPTIAARTTAIAHYFSSDECLFFPPGDADALSAVLAWVVEDPRRLAAIRVRLGAARSRLSWTTEKRKYIDIVRWLAEMDALAGAPDAVV